MCIDICPVGALTSGSYRYKTRPWEMNHVSTVCTHCGDGCKVTLGVRQSNDGSEIVRADNRDKSGINGDFLCAKGRFGFDFVENPDRLTSPLVRNSEGNLEPATWEHALRFAANKLKEIRDSRPHSASGAAIGVIGSNHTTNEENYLLQKFARSVLKTNSIDHERTTDYAGFARALAGHQGKAASLREIAKAPAILLVGGNPTDEHPLLAWNLRTNVRLNKARLYIANAKPIKLERQAKAVLRLPADGYTALADYLGGSNAALGNAAFREAMLAEESLLVILGQEYRGAQIADSRGLGPQERQCALRLPGRPRQLARSRRHGPSARSASGLCAGDGSGRLRRRVSGNARNAGHDAARDVRSSRKRRTGRIAGCGRKSRRQAER